MKVKELVNRLSDCDPEAEVVFYSGLDQTEFDALVRSCGVDVVAKVIQTATFPNGRVIPTQRPVRVRLVEFISALPAHIPEPLVGIHG